MIVDSSAVLAILLDEPDAGVYALALAGSPSRRMAAPNWFEAAMVAESRGGPDTAKRFDEFMVAQEVDIVPFDQGHAAAAREAWRRYGCGRHPAGLNFGDCIAYALAAAEAHALLFKGNDFPLTDIEPALRD